MKALTISQPFASLIASGEKWIENRTWETLYRGPLAIHAGKGTQYLTRKQLAGYPTSCVIAVCQLVACEHVMTVRQSSRLPGRILTGPRGSKRTWREIDDHEHCEGPFCWILEDVRLVGPFATHGAQGLWEFDVAAEVLR